MMILKDDPSALLQGFGDQEPFLLDCTTVCSSDQTDGVSIFLATYIFFFFSHL